MDRFVAWAGTRRALGVLFAVALTLRLAWLLANHPVPISDFAQYHRLASDLFEHRQFGYPHPTAERLPGFPFFLACAMVVSESPLWLGAVTSLLGSGLVVLVYWFALRLARKVAVATLAAGFCAVNPTLVGSACLLASEHLGTFLTLASLLAALECRRRYGAGTWLPSALAIAAGTLLGMAILTRGEALFYVPAVVLVLSAPKRHPRVSVLAGTLSVVAAGAVVAPWYVRNQAIDERAGLSTTSGLNFYMAHNASGYGRSSEKDEVFSGLSQVEKNELGWELGFRHLRATHVGGVLRSLALGTAHLWGEPPMYAVKWSTVTKDTPAQKRWNSRLAYRAPGYAAAIGFYYALLVLACMAWRYRKKLDRPTVTAALTLISMNWVCYAVIFWGKARYRYPTEVLLCVFAAITLCELIRARSIQARARTDQQPTKPG